MMYYVTNPFVLICRHAQMTQGNCPIRR